MKIKSVNFVSLSDLKPSNFFCEELRNGNFTWGDTDHTLVSKEHFLNELTHMDTSKTMITKVVKLPDNIFIDLES